MNKDFYDICRDVWEWEDRHNISYAARLTEWYGDLAMCVPLPGVDNEQVRQRQNGIEAGKQIGEILESTSAVHALAQEAECQVSRSFVPHGLGKDSPNVVLRDTCSHPLTINSGKFIGTKPKKVCFPDGTVMAVKNWRGAALAILKACDANPECHEKLLVLRDKNIISGPRRSILGGDPAQMDSPLEIGPSLYFEGHFGTEYLLKMVCRTLDLAGYDYRSVSFQLRERDEPTL